MEAQRRGQQTNTQFWSNQPDPVLIERGQADAIQLVRSTVNARLGVAPNEPIEVNTTGTSGVPTMVFVDDEGLEEQFLTEDEASQNILDITANRANDTHNIHNTTAGSRRGISSDQENVLESQHNLEKVC